MHETQGWKDALEANGWADFYRTGDEAQEYIDAEVERVAALYEDLGTVTRPRHRPSRPWVTPRAGRSARSPSAPGIVLISGVLLSQVFAIVSPDGFSPRDRGSCRWSSSRCCWCCLRSTSPSRPPRSAAAGSLPAEPFAHVRAAALLVASGRGYAFLVGPVGYVPATAVFFVAARPDHGLAPPGARHRHRGRAVPARLPVSFTRALGVFLPQGVFPL